MRTEKILTLLIALVLIAAAVVFWVKSSGTTDEAVETAPVTVDASGSADLLVIGVQGLEQSLVDRLSKAGRLPNISSLISRGATGRYPTFGRRTDVQIVWTSLVTGMLPENQGIGGTMISPRGDVVEAPLTPKHRTVGAIWTYLGAGGEPCGVVSWPATWPVESIEGVMVGPLPTFILERRHGGDPSDGISPVSERPRYDPLMIDHATLERADLSRFVNTDTRLGLESLMGQNRVALATAYAVDRSAVDLATEMAASGIRNLFVNLGGVDVASQRFWHYMETEAIERIEVSEDERRLLEGEIEALGETVERYYEFADALVGELLELASDDAVIALVSDHGYSGIMFDDNDMPKVGTNMHSEEATWVLVGPGVAEGVSLGRHRLIDVAPTIMEAAGVTADIELDGDVLEAAFGR